MRIANLQDDNLRTQGPARRHWYRTHNPQHLDMIARLLQQALRLQPAGALPRAVVLGAGACTELPFDLLASTCAEIYLVDLDQRGMERARGELPAYLHERIRTVQADITGGVSAALAAELRVQPWTDLAALAGEGGAAPLDAAAGCIERCIVPDPPVLSELEAHGYSLVISSLVLTQLFNLPLLDVVDTLSMYVPWAVDMRETHERYRWATESFRRRVALAHLHLISSLLALGGAAVFITDVTGYLTPAQAGPHAGTVREAIDVLPPSALSLPEDLSTRFSIAGKRRHWTWIVQEPAATRPGRSYDVFGVVLTQRKAAHALSGAE